MPKNTTGGKKHKKGKNHTVIDAPLELKTADQNYASVTSLLGNGRLRCNVYTPQLSDGEIIFNAKEKLGIIRGSMRKKKQWIKNGDIIIVCERDYQDDKVDVVHVYKDTHAKKLIKKNQIPNLDFINNTKNEEENIINFNVSDSDNDDSDEPQEAPKNRGNNITNVSYIPNNEFNLNESDSDLDIQNI